MEEPSTAADLQRYLCGLNWMRTSIPAFARLAEPLLQLLRTCQERCGGLTKQKLRSVRLRPFWTPELAVAFGELKQALLDRLTLSHPDPKKTTFLYTDASTDFYAAVCTQIPTCDLEKPVEDQRHEPLAFISARFVKASLNWSVVEKEAFAVSLHGTYEVSDLTHRSSDIHRPSQSPRFIQSARYQSHGCFSRSFKAAPMGNQAQRFRL